MSNFKEFRKKNKLTQIDAAKYLNCTQSFISQIEKQLCAIPEKFISKILDDKLYDAEALLHTKEDEKERDYSVDLQKIISLLEDKVHLLEDKADRQEREISSLRLENESLKKELSAAAVVRTANAG